ncbi:tyrosine-type recombinase/integrase [Aliarcobacter cryaerophilus]|uniref:tyrosine-type recombinase/integrase n=1 Tax=Aliarcobacter cryaerophilus TaxID=28198 RepID=UPI0019D2FE46|nr:tyrosine-type recombinase/integrase [Aliarcobacter cryaerophilus]
MILDTLFNQGIDKYDRKNKVVIHTLRHTFASHLAINGTPIFTIQKLMNHKDIKMTMRYAKLSPDSGREAVLNLGL